MLILSQLWTEQTSREFIEKNYVWFLKTYDEYPFPVQRTDTVRYFLLRHYGGIYLDLDNVSACYHPICFHTSEFQSHPTSCFRSPWITFISFPNRLLYTGLLRKPRAVTLLPYLYYRWWSRRSQQQYPWKHP
jgi:hypothetical protein